jgi:hypothetical protein
MRFVIYCVGLEAMQASLAPYDQPHLCKVLNRKEFIVIGMSDKELDRLWRKSSRSR